MEKSKIIPYRTSTGILIGQFYEPKPAMDYTPDMELLQCALLNDPSFLRKVKLKNMAYTASVIAAFVLLAMVAR